MGQDRKAKMYYAEKFEKTDKRCPACGVGRLNFHCGDYGTGVFAPDGYQETVWEEFFQCNRCQEKFDPDDTGEKGAL